MSDEGRFKFPDPSMDALRMYAVVNHLHDLPGENLTEEIENLSECHGCDSRQMSEYIFEVCVPDWDEALAYWRAKMQL